MDWNAPQVGHVLLYGEGLRMMESSLTEDDRSTGPLRPSEVAGPLTNMNRADFERLALWAEHRVQSDDVPIVVIPTLAMFVVFAVAYLLLPGRWVVALCLALVTGPLISQACMLWHRPVTRTRRGLEAAFPDDYADLRTTLYEPFDACGTLLTPGQEDVQAEWVRDLARHLPDTITHTDN